MRPGFADDVDKTKAREARDLLNAWVAPDGPNHKSARRVWNAYVAALTARNIPRLPISWPKICVVLHGLVRIVR